MVKYTFCFMYTYSMREKTRAFHRFTDNVPPEVKNKRYLEMVDTFRVLAGELNNTKLNQVHLVLVDQVSKRSASDFSGRNDNNTLVNFEKCELPIINGWSDLQNYSGEKVMPKIGDYVACRLVKATSQSFRAVPLFSCKLQAFDSIKKSTDLDKFNFELVNSLVRASQLVN
jgi:tRNA A37 methylthiotransferase MiaB